MFTTDINNRVAHFYLVNCQNSSDLQISNSFEKLRSFCMETTKIVIVIGAEGANYTLCISLLSWSSVKRRVLENKMLQKAYKNIT